jgi:hypothetical protein
MKLKTSSIAENITESTAIELEKIQGLTLINAVISFDSETPGQTHANLKRELLNSLNNQLKTKYEMKHIDNWVSSRAETPKRVKRVLQLHLLQYLFGDDAAQILHDILIK